MVLVIEQETQIREKQLGTSFFVRLTQREKQKNTKLKNKKRFMTLPDLIPD